MFVSSGVFTSGLLNDLTLIVCLSSSAVIAILHLSSGPPPPVQETMDANLQKLTQLVNKESNLIEKVHLLSLSSLLHGFMVAFGRYHRSYRSTVGSHHFCSCILEWQLNCASFTVDGWQPSQQPAAQTAQTRPQTQPVQCKELHPCLTLDLSALITALWNVGEQPGAALNPTQPPTDLGNAIKLGYDLNGKQTNQ